DGLRCEVRRGLPRDVQDRAWGAARLDREWGAGLPGPGAVRPDAVQDVRPARPTSTGCCRHAGASGRGAEPRAWDPAWPRVPELPGPTVPEPGRPARPGVPGWAPGSAVRASEPRAWGRRAWDDPHLRSAPVQPERAAGPGGARRASERSTERTSPERLRTGSYRTIHADDGR